MHKQSRPRSTVLPLTAMALAACTDVTDPNGALRGRETTPNAAQSVMTTNSPAAGRRVRRDLTVGAVVQRVLVRKGETADLSCARSARSTSFRC